LTIDIYDGEQSRRIHKQNKHVFACDMHVYHIVGSANEQSFGAYPWMEYPYSLAHLDSLAT
jgi:hypothetical protein